MDPQNTPQPNPVPEPSQHGGFTPSNPPTPPPLPSAPPTSEPTTAVPTPTPQPSPAPYSPPAADSSFVPTSPNQPLAEPSADAAKQQVVDRLKSANNVLVTVGSKPTVDELSTALGLTLQLDKLDKHATTVFSGEIPRAIEFLDPEATFEDNVDSLRDFIIALDKEKADKLRYKVEDDVVRIFITPYKTKISEDDLKFSQGDFNVEVIVALGVVTRNDLDKAITAHGRILHDATVITVNAGGDISNIGEINWSDDDASSLAEMVSDVGGQLGDDMLDSQISTAYLTGVVAATNRFSNEKTTPKVMNLSAQLMAAGANQQLIASNLRQDGVLTESINNPSDDHAESEVQVEHDRDKADKKNSDKADDKKTDKKGDDSDKKDSTETDSKKPDTKLDKPPDFPPKPDKSEQKKNDVKPDLELPDDLKEQLVKPSSITEEAGAKIETTQAPNEDITDVKSDTVSAQEPLVPPAPVEPSSDKPAFNASMAQAEAEKQSTADKPVEVQPGQPDAASQAAAPPLPPAPSSAPAPTPVSDASPTDDSSAQTQANADEPSLDDARKAVEEAMGEGAFNPANQPIASIGAQELPPVHEEGASNQTAPEQDNSSPAPQPSSGSAEPPALPSVDNPAQPSTEPSAQGTSAVSSGLPPAPSPDENFLSGGLDKPEPSPMDSFMSAHQKGTIQPESSSEPTADTNTAAPSSDTTLPPPPPMPQVGSDGSLPPLPTTAAPTDGQPPVPPLNAPDVNPEFMQNTPASQNPLTQAADDLAAKRSEDDANRQAKMDQMTDQYNSAVDVNMGLQGKPPVNNDQNRT